MMDNRIYDVVYLQYIDPMILYMSNILRVPVEDAKDMASEVLFLVLQHWDELQTYDSVSLCSWTNTAMRNKYYEYQRACARFCGQYSLDENRVGMFEGDTFVIFKDFVIESMYPTDDQDQLFNTYIEKIKQRLNYKECRLLDVMIAEKLDYRKMSIILNQSEECLRTRVYRLRVKIKGFLEKIFEST